MSEQTAKIRTGFTFYRSFRDAIRLLSTRDQLRIYQAIADYALDQTLPDVDTLSKAAQICWVTILPNLQSGIDAFHNGCKGGAPKGNRNAQKTTPKQPRNNHPSLTESNNGNVDVNEYVDENENENENKRVSIRTRSRSSDSFSFKPPTLEEVRDYIALKGLDAKAEAFADYYTANGWRVGRSPMRDWQAALRNWARRDFPPATPAKTPDCEPPRPIYKAL